MAEKKGLLKEFREFAVKGNVVDMATGVIIGGAFSKIVTSVVNDLLMPLIGVVIGGMNFSDLAIVLKEAEGETEAVLFKYGSFIQSVVDFLIVALCIFFMVRAINRLRDAHKKKEEEAAPPPPPEPTETEKLLGEIRDLLKEGK